MYSSQHYTFIRSPSSEAPPSKPRRTDSDRCDVHHCIAQLYLRTIPSLDSSPTTIAKPGRSRRSSSLTPSPSKSKMAPTTTTCNPLVGGGGGALIKSPTFSPGASFLQSQSESFPALGSTDDSSSSASSSCSGTSDHVTSTQLRAVLASSMSTMYRSEVPLYGDLLSIISRVNSDVIRANPDVISDDESSRLNVERHGAIRVGTPQELTLLSRIFKLFGMHAVGYYDLWANAGLPIHATAFRPVRKEELQKNPFRIFCSLLRIDLVSDATTRQLTEQLLSKRKILSDRCMSLLLQAESQLPTDTDEDEQEMGVKGLTRSEALEFVEEVVKIFAWHPNTPVSMEEYRLLSATHPLVADIVSFRGPHINHLTPRTLDIDAVQRRMVLQGIDAKEVVEGPPARREGIYLRQTSFHALRERVVFLGDRGEEEGRHQARFGEIEARGQSLTPKGARLYDELMAKVAQEKRERERRGERMGKEQCAEILQKVFEDGFPDDRDMILSEGLGYFMFSVRDGGKAREMCASARLADMVKEGALEAEPITYEDFLPASAAGIFQSNLPRSSSAASKSEKQQEGAVDAKEARKRFEAAVGGRILDYFELYAEQQRKSLVDVANVLGVDAGVMVKKVDSEEG
ncbi:hypothetical protein NDA13_004926 [Ustilago tritici]|nr:hypothetical protein NDA13_004926 [Ustilago tritici]